MVAERVLLHIHSRSNDEAISKVELCIVLRRSIRVTLRF